MRNFFFFFSVFSLSWNGEHFGSAPFAWESVSCSGIDGVQGHQTGQGAEL